LLIVFYYGDRAKQGTVKSFFEKAERQMAASNTEGEGARKFPWL
jgi:hypothetical protein